MGWGVGFVDHRWVGYGVPSVCDQPTCEAEIDRGLSYVCGGMHGGGESGCGRYFCDKHLYYLDDESDDAEVCAQCLGGKPPFDPKPDTAEWVEHMLTDGSWAKWRQENAAEVARLQDEGSE